MKKNRLILFVFILMIVMLMTGCAIGPRADSIPGITADEANVYVSFQQFVYKVDSATGKELWRYPEKGSIQVVFYAPPLIDGEKLYVGDLANKFHQIDVNSGKENWSFSQAKGWLQAKAASDGTQIFVPCSDRNVYAIDIDGNLRWTYSSDYGFLATPLIINDMVVISSMDHNVVALDKNSGNSIWKTKLSGSIVSAPFYDEETDQLFVGSLGKEFVSLDRATGNVKWKFDGSGSLGSIWSTPVVIEQQLIFTDEKGQIISLNAETGNQLWKIDAGGPVMGGIAVIEGGFLVALEDGNLRAYDINQNLLWSRSIEANIYTTPVISGEMIIVAAKKGSALLYSFDQKGNQIWTFSPEK